MHLGPRSQTSKTPRFVLGDCVDVFIKLNGWTLWPRFTGTYYSSTILTCVLVLGEHQSGDANHDPYPTLVEKANGKKALVVRNNVWGKYLGCINVTFDANGDVTSWNKNPILLDASVPEGMLSVCLIWSSRISVNMYKYVKCMFRVMTRVAPLYPLYALGSKASWFSKNTLYYRCWNLVFSLCTTYAGVQCSHFVLQMLEFSVLTLYYRCWSFNRCGDHES